MAMPPIAPGPFLQPWRGNDRPRLNRPSISAPPYSGGGGLLIPEGSPQTFSLQQVGIANGSRKFAVTTSSVKILDAPATYRNFLLIRNSSSAAVDVYVEFGADATTDSAIILAQNEILLMDAVVLQDDIYVIGSAAGQVSILVSVIELPT